MARSLRVPAIGLAALLGVALASCVFGVASVHADGRVVLYGLRMDPGDLNHKAHPRPGIGAGLEMVETVPCTAGLFAGVGGVEAVNLQQSGSVTFDRFAQPDLELDTSQDYVRAFVGGQLGSHGNGLIRPYMGLNLALLVYSYTTDSLPLSDAPADNSSPRDVWTTSETAFGWDANAGIDLDFHDHWMLDVGVRYVHSTGVPRAPAFNAVRFDPAYLQYRVGIGFGHSNAVQD